MALTQQQINQMDGIVGGGVSSSGNVSPQGSQQKLPSWMHWLLPAAGATVGGVTGGGLGALLGLETGPGAALTGYAGGVTGAGIGAGLGQGAVNGWEHALGNKSAPANTGQQLGSMAKAGEAGAISQAISGPLAKGMGIVAHPITNMSNFVDNALARSPAKVDIGKIIENYAQNNLPKMEQKMIPGAQQSFDSLATRMTGAVKRYQPHIGTDNPVPSQGLEDAVQNQPFNPNYATGQQYGINTGLNAPEVNASDMHVPIGQANQIKKDLTGPLHGMYGGDTRNVDVETAKQMGSLLAKQINSQNGHASLGNWIMHNILYPAPNVIDAVGNALPAGGNKMYNVLSGGVGKTAQTLIPANGGYLGKAFPFLGTLLGNNQSQ